MYAVKNLVSSLEYTTLQSVANIGVVWYHTKPAYAPEALTVITFPTKFDTLWWYGTVCPPAITGIFPEMTSLLVNAVPLTMCAILPRGTFSNFVL